MLFDSISDRAAQIGGVTAVQTVKYYLAVLGMIKDEAAVLPEWLEHHLAHGIDHFYLIGWSSQKKEIVFIALFV